MIAANNSIEALKKILGKLAGFKIDVSFGKTFEEILSSKTTAPKTIFINYESGEPSGHYENRILNGREEAITLFCYDSKIEILDTIDAIIELLYTHGSFQDKYSLIKSVVIIGWQPIQDDNNKVTFQIILNIKEN